MPQWITLPLVLSTALLGTPSDARSEGDRTWKIDGQPVLRSSENLAPCWQLWSATILCHHGRWERENDPRGLAQASSENSRSRKSGETTPRFEYLMNPESPAAKIFQGLSHPIPRTKGVMVIDPRLEGLHAALLYIRYEDAPRVLKSFVGPQPTGTSTTLFVVSEATRSSHVPQDHLWTVHWPIDHTPGAGALLNALLVVDSLQIESSRHCQGDSGSGAQLLDCVENQSRSGVSNFHDSFR